MGKDMSKELAPSAVSIMSQLIAKALANREVTPGNAHFAAKVAGYLKAAPKPKKRTPFVERQQAINNRFKNRGRRIA